MTIWSAFGRHPASGMLLKSSYNLLQAAHCHCLQGDPHDANWRYWFQGGLQPRHQVHRLLLRPAYVDLPMVWNSTPHPGPLRWFVLQILPLTPRPPQEPRFRPQVRAISRSSASNSAMEYSRKSYTHLIVYPTRLALTLKLQDERTGRMGIRFSRINN